MKKLIIVTGPQGSGNHLFGRLLSIHDKVGGWKELMDNYWVPSDEEPFADFWVDPDKLSIADFEGYDYWLANVSVPFVYDGVKQVPKIIEFVQQVQHMGIDVQVCVIVRDQYINALQQQRVRKETTLPVAVDYFETLLDVDCPVHYVDPVTLPSSNICNSMLDISGCAFSISSNNMIEYGFLVTSDINLPPPTLPSSNPT